MGLVCLRKNTKVQSGVHKGESGGRWENTKGPLGHGQGSEFYSMRDEKPPEQPCPQKNIASHEYMPYLWF